MELSFARCEQIVKTLPVGYYANRRVPITISNEAETSYYELMNDRIVISYPIIAERCAKMQSSTTDEEAVRTMMYHEVSHAILTPTVLKSTDVINIFEDERIETVLRNRYMGVNFKQQIMDLMGGKIPVAYDATQAFFNAVRLGAGPKEYQKRINAVIAKHSKVNRNSSIWTVIDYRHDIEELYEEIEKCYKKNPNKFNNTSDSSANPNNANKSDNTNKSDNAMPCASTGRPDCCDKATTDEIINKAFKKYSDNDASQLSDLQKKIEIIINNFNKKNNTGNGINAYTGVFNPRSVVRKDYRYFDKPVTTQGNNKFGSCHLNLIIDCSGSFYRNQDLTNGILAVLSEIERKNRNFSLDVAFINDEFRMCKTVEDRKFSACGGNKIPENMRDILIKMQKPNTCNYTIVLFDGDALSDNYDLSQKEMVERFRAFDRKQLTLITDPDNEEYMHDKFTSAKVVITSNYTEELVNHIIQALTSAYH